MQTATEMASRTQVRLFRPVIREEAIAAVAEVLRSGWIGLGPKTAEFEGAFAMYTGASYCVGVNSCTAALHLAIKLLDLPAGTEVITTPVTFVSTNHVLLYERLKPVFADVEPYTGNIDFGSVAKRITPNTGGVIVMHYGGYPCALDDFGRLGLPIIEDCAHACGAEYRGRRIGGSENIHAFSFHAVKNLPMGDGGAVTTNSFDYCERLIRLRWLGIDKSTFQRSDDVTGKTYSWEYGVNELGYKYHMNDISAAIGLVQLAYLEEDNARRAEIAAIYTAELADVPGVRLMEHEADRRSSHHLHGILVDARDDLVDKLRASGVEVGMHYKRNDRYPMYEEQDLPNTEYFCSHEVSLPIHLRLTDEDVQHVCRLIREGW